MAARSTILESDPPQPPLHSDQREEKKEEKEEEKTRKRRRPRMHQNGDEAEEEEEEEKDKPRQAKKMNLVDPKGVRALFPQIICAICLDFIMEPAVTACDHMYCVACIDRIVADALFTGESAAAKCPTCRRLIIKDEIALVSIKNPLAYRCLFGNILVTCSISKECKWQGSYMDLSGHLEKSCSFANVPCVHCHAYFPRHQLATHSSSICEIRPMECGDCHQQIRAHDFRLHAGECMAALIKCSKTAAAAAAAAEDTEFKGCGIILARVALADHFENHCPDYLVSCPLAHHGCLERIRRANVKEHMDQSCATHVNLISARLDQLISRVDNLSALVSSRSGAAVAAADPLLITNRGIPAGASASASAAAAADADIVEEVGETKKTVIGWDGTSLYNLSLSSRGIATAQVWLIRNLLPRRFIGLVHAGDHVYMTGGYSESLTNAVCSSVSRLQIMTTATTTTTTTTTTTSVQQAIGRWGHQSCLCGLWIYSFGGTSSAIARLTSIERFSVNTLSSESLTPCLREPRTQAAGVFFTLWAPGPGETGAASSPPSHRYYLIGGEDPSGPSSAEYYDFGLGYSVAIASPLSKRIRGCAIVYKSVIFLFGGTTNGGIPMTSIEEYNPATNTWRLSPLKLPFGPSRCCAHIVGSKLFVLGCSLSTWIVLDLFSGWFTTIQHMPCIDTITTH